MNRKNIYIDMIAEMLKDVTKDYEEMQSIIESYEEAYDNGYNDGVEEIQAKYDRLEAEHKELIDSFRQLSLLAMAKK